MGVLFQHTDYGIQHPVNILLGVAEKQNWSCKLAGVVHFRLPENL